MSGLLVWFPSGIGMMYWDFPSVTAAHRLDRSPALDRSNVLLSPGLHSLDFPWLYNYRPAWDIVVITFMVGGTALCVTPLILAWRVLGRKLRIILPTTPRGTVLNEDLV